DILYMKLGNQILFRRGAKPRICRRYNILENEMYKKITREYEKRIARNRKSVSEEIDNHTEITIRAN
ncbi:MAG: type VI secretion protein, partial [Lachnospiraceae bacterium]